VDSSTAWGVAFIAYLLFWAIWARFDLMLVKPEKPSHFEKAKWEAVEARFNKRSLIWSGGLVVFLAVWFLTSGPP